MRIAARHQPGRLLRQGGGRRGDPEILRHSLEGDPQRTACDYLTTGISLATGRWGPTWTWNGKPCDGENFSSCANQSDNQFMAIAKTTGDYEACASSEVTIAAEGQRCGKVTIQ